MLSNSLFIQLAVILGLCSSLGYLMKLFRLPLIVAYLVAGVLLSFINIFDIVNAEVLTVFPEIGVAFVLFFIGMELDIKEIKSLGKPIVLGSLGQITISILAGFVIAMALGLSQSESLLLGIGLAFSSTIVVVKLLLEKKEINSLHGKLSLGITLVEDLVAVVVLMALTVSSSLANLGLQNSYPLLMLFIKAILLFILALGLSRYALEKVFKAIARSPELLFLSALAWCFIFVAISLILGFSIVIGAFLAGVALANSSFHYEIQGKVKPLRDFFVTLFFVYLGSQVKFAEIGLILPIIIIFTLYTLIAKPIIFLLILGSLGFRKHTIFQTALSLSQISEFSLIILVVGTQMSLVSSSAITAMALVGVLSIASSSIMIYYSHFLFRILKPFIAFFERDNLTHQIEVQNINNDLADHVIIIGGHLMGGEIVRFLQKEKTPFLIVDFNPKVIQGLTSEGIPAMYGDIGDLDIIEFLNLEKARLIISTAPAVEDNLILLSEAKRRKVQAAVILRANSATEMETLYLAGADYVIMPEVLSGSFLASVLKSHWPNMEYFKDRSAVELHKLAHNHFALE